MTKTDNITLSVIIFYRYKEGVKALIDLGTCHYRMRGDYKIRNENLEKGEELCPRCDGTGNEFYYKYRSCSDCKGTGIKRES